MPIHSIRPGKVSSIGPVTIISPSGHTSASVPVTPTTDILSVFCSYLPHEENYIIANDATIVESSAATAYPASNLKILPIAKPWRSTNCVSESLRFDLGSAVPVNLLALVNHNLTEDATVIVYAGSTSNPDGGEFDSEIPWREFDAFKLFETNKTYRYWKFIFQDSTNTDGFIKLGLPIIGLANTFDFHWRYGSGYGEKYFNQSLKSGGGVPYVEPKYRICQYEFEYGPLTVAEANVLRDLYRQLNGNAQPLFLIPESDGTDAYFGRFTGDFYKELEFRETTSCYFEEDGRGRTVTA